MNDYSTRSGASGTSSPTSDVTSISGESEALNESNDLDTLSEGLDSNTLSETMMEGGTLTVGGESGYQDLAPLSSDTPHAGDDNEFALPASTLNDGDNNMSDMSDNSAANTMTADAPPTTSGPEADVQPMSEVTMPYDKQPEIAPKPAPVPLGDIHLSDIKESAGQALDHAKESAGQAVTAVKETAGHALDQARGQVKSQITAQKDRAADSLGDLTHSVQQFSDTFRSNNLPMLAGYTDTLAEQVDRVTGYIKNNEVEVLVKDAEKFARDNSGAFITGAVILGIALGRFLRASNRNLAYNGERNALVPVQRMDQFGGMTNSAPRPTERQDVMNDTDFTTGQKPFHAQDYVPGGVMGGATS